MNPQTLSSHSNGTTTHSSNCVHIDEAPPIIGYASSGNTITSTDATTWNTTVNAPWVVEGDSLPLMGNTIPFNKKGYKISIESQDHGFLVSVGCKTFCIESPEKLCKALKKYLRNPNEVEAQFNSGEFNLDEL